MLQIERTEDFEELFRTALLGWQAGIWTALPGYVTKFNATAVTVEVQPTIQAKFTDPDTGAVSDVTLPLLLDVPVWYPKAGPFVLTFPIAVNDEVLVVFASRCIDAWWQSGGVQPQADLRMHDLSDGFALPGIFSQPKAAQLTGGVSTTATQLRTLDGATYFELIPNGDGYLARMAADDVELYGRKSFSWSVQGYGERYTWDGGSNLTHSTWQTGAVVTDAPHAFNPPDIPEGE